MKNEVKHTAHSSYRCEYHVVFAPKYRRKVIYKTIRAVSYTHLVSSSFSTQTSYENQTKKAITNRFIQEAMTEFLRHNLEVYFLENKAEADRFCDQVLVNKRSREKAETTRLNLKKTLQSGNDLTSRVQSFVDCRTREVSQRELFIVEGKSAMGACIQARNPDFQAIIPVRGKILNCLKAEYDKIFKNEIITDLLKVLGCGVEVKSKANNCLLYTSRCV